MSNEKAGDRVEANAIAEFQTMTVTGLISHRDDQRRTFIIAYMAGYLKAQGDVIKQLQGEKQ